MVDKEKIRTYKVQTIIYIYLLVEMTENMGKSTVAQDAQHRHAGFEMWRGKVGQQFHSKMKTIFLN